MEVILLEKVANLGNLGEKVSVKSGFGRNFLIPQGKAVFASAENIKLFEERRAELEQPAAANLAADLSRDARFRLVDEPVLEAGRAEVQAQMGAHLDALAEDPNRSDRAERITAVVQCPQPMRELILRHRLAAGGDPDLQSALLEIRARRWYRIRALHDLRVVDVDGVSLCVADYEFEGRSIHVVLAFTAWQDLPATGRAIAGHLAGVDPARSPVVDLMCWRSEGAPNGDELSRAVADELAEEADEDARHRAAEALTRAELHREIERRGQAVEYRDLLREHSDGLVCLSACLAGEIPVGETVTIEGWIPGSCRSLRKPSTSSVRVAKMPTSISPGPNAIRSLRLKSVATGQ